jgi:hypothetical protein
MKIAPFLQNRREFLSMWDIAHEWEGIDASSNDPNSPPEEIRHWLHKLILGYFRKELSLRKTNGYRVLPDDIHLFLINLNRYRERLAACLFKGIYQPELLHGTFVMRSEILAWCDKEYIDPPTCWTLAPQRENATTNDSDSEYDLDGWYGRITDQRKQKVACLELAKRLWQQDRSRSYEEVRMHPLMIQTGFHTVFSPDTFKKWAREFAPQEAKQGGRRSASST